MDETRKVANIEKKTERNRDIDEGIAKIVEGRECTIYGENRG